MSTPGEAVEAAEPVATADTVLIGGKPVTIAEATRAMRGSAHWFWWVAGLSLANTVAAWLDLQYGMVLGLGITQLIDALFFYGVDGVRSAPGMVGAVFHIGLVLAVAGVFVLIGHLAARGSVRAFVVGMVLYTMDALLYLLATDWIAIAFHAFVLFMLFAGMTTARALRDRVPMPPPRPAG
jgi:hypothetical protein